MSEGSRRWKDPGYLREQQKNNQAGVQEDGGGDFPLAWGQYSAAWRRRVVLNDINQVRINKLSLLIPYQEE